MKKILLLSVLVFLLTAFSSSFNISFATKNNTVCVFLFYSNGCPHCAQERPFLQQLLQKYPIDLHEFEVGNPDNSNLWYQISNKYKTQPIGVPMTFIGDKVFIGFAYGDQEVFNSQYNAFIGYSSVIEKAIKEYVEKGGAGCPSEISPSSAINQTFTLISQSANSSINLHSNIILIVILIIAIGTIFVLLRNKIKIKIKKGVISFLFAFLLLPFVLAQEVQVPLIGKISGETPVIILGMILGLMDGVFNPCALSVLFFLIAYLMGLGSKRKCLVIGTIYSLMIFVIYALFMFGILNVIYYVGNLSLIEKVIGAALIIFGIIEIKDFFFYGKGFSLEIPKSASPYIEKLIKAATIPSALILGLLVALVEIPCAGAFPFFYTTLLASKGIQGIENILYILWYNIFFVSPLLILTLIFYLGFAKVEEAEKKRLKLRKYMRLTAGIIMILLGLSILVGWL
jgi:thiol-disulfide isomerase/thioredoxin